MSQRCLLIFASSTFDQSTKIRAVKKLSLIQNHPNDHDKTGNCKYDTINLTLVIRTPPGDELQHVFERGDRVLSVSQALNFSLLYAALANVII